MIEFQVGDRVQIPSGKIGTVIEPDNDFPLHYLIQFDDGGKLHILKRIVKPAIETKVKSRKK